MQPDAPKPAPKIQGLIVQPLTRFPDERGDFREILRAGVKGLETLKQVSASVVFQGIAKGWHLHKQQTEAMTAVQGVVKFAFADRRNGSPTKGQIDEFLCDATATPLLFVVPPGVAHGYRCASGPGVVVYITSHSYDPADQFHIPHDLPDIGYRWDAPEIK